MTKLNFEEDSSLSEELIVWHLYVHLRFQVSAQRFVEYDEVRHIWVEVSFDELLDRVQSFVRVRPVLCTPTSTTLNFYERVAKALHLYLREEFVTIPGVMTKYGFLNYLTRKVQAPSYRQYCFNYVDDCLRSDMRMKPVSQQFFRTFVMDLICKLLF